jgi:hypothetical protein
MGAATSASACFANVERGEGDDCGDEQKERVHAGFLAGDDDALTTGNWSTVDDRDELAGDDGRFQARGEIGAFFAIERAVRHPEVTAGVLADVEDSELIFDSPHAMTRSDVPLAWGDEGGLLGHGRSLSELGPTVPALLVSGRRIALGQKAMRHRARRRSVDRARGPDRFGPCIYFARFWARRLPPDG